MKLWRIRKEERRPALRLWAGLFLSACANLLAWSVLTAVFLKTYGIGSFPLVFLLSSAASMVGSALYARLAARASAGASARIFSLAAAVLLALAAARAGEGGLAFFALLLLGNSAFVSFVGSQLMVVANDRFTPSQGKRLFPLVNTAHVVSGVTAGLFLDRFVGTLGIGGMLMAAAALALLALPCAARTRADKREASQQGEVGLFAYVRGNRYVLVLAGIVAISWVLTRAFDVAFASVADARFPTAEAYVRFSGLYLVVTSLSAVLFDALLLNRLLERIGLTRGMAFVSNAVTAGVAAMLIVPTFWPVIAANAVRSVLIDLQATSMQVMQGVLPSARRAGVNAFLEGYLATAAGALGALAMLAFDALVPSAFAPSDSMRILAALMLLLLAVRAWLNARLRARFFETLHAQVRQGDDDARLRALETLVEHKFYRQEGIGLVIDVAKDPRASVALKETALSTLGAVADPSTLRVLYNLLSGRERAVRLGAARAIAAFPAIRDSFFDDAFSRHHAVEKLRALFAGEPDPEVRAVALDALVKLEDPDIVPFLAKLLRDGDAQAKADCLYSLLRFNDPGVIDDVRPLLREGDPALRALAVRVIWPFPWERKALKDAIAGLFPVLKEETFRRLPAARKEAFRLGTKLAGDIRLQAETKRLRALLGWTDRAIRLEAALSLSKLGEKDGPEAVRTLLSDKKRPELDRVDHSLKWGRYEPDVRLRLVDTLEEMAETPRKG
ncbi:hypothetical protein EPO34_01630 [Patescibacteria group bacterium]|nr:MAG: hypothetical protein EPO34_01630 [Patescibacteria group bacterium]